jgi:2-polyprenyl-6-methoxyphenol hydroxylase-like FAD-dependent oxidoreductase
LAPVLRDFSPPPSSPATARATAIQPGTLEILDSVGLLPPFLETAEHVHRVRLYDPDMFELGGLDFEGIDCGCEFQCSLPQYETERILEGHLASLGGAVERGGYGDEGGD